MAKLMIATDPPDPSEPVAKSGGVPVAPAGFVWPRCSHCNGPMQFLAQIPLAETGIAAFRNCNQLLLLFQCQNDPGMCDEWDPDSGGNAAMRVPLEGDLIPISPPPLSAEERNRGLTGETTLGKTEGVMLEEYDDDTPEAYLAALGDESRLVVGKLGGRPVWLQADETPYCSCGNKMTFIAQIENIAGGGINFGDAGTGYAFACAHCGDRAKFLWQCL